MSEIRIIVTGSRTFMNYSYMAKELDQYISSYQCGDVHISLISGTARGADSLCERYAYEHDLPLHQFLTDPDIPVQNARKVRNRKMASFAISDGANGVLMAFWDGKSHGTMDMLRIAKKYGIKTYVFR